MRSYCGSLVGSQVWSMNNDVADNL